MLLPYFGLDSGAGSLQLENDEDDEGLEGPIRLSGSTAGLGDFTLRIVEDERNARPTPFNHAADFGDKLNRWAFAGVPVLDGQAWRARGACGLSRECDG